MYSDDLLQKVKLVLDYKHELVFDKNTLSIINYFIEFVISKNDAFYTNIFLFHFHTVGYEYYVYFVYGITGKHNNDYGLRSNKSIINDTLHTERLRDIYMPLVKMARYY